MLVRWGLGRAIKDGVPAYIEASVAGMPVYEKCGFTQVGTFSLDLGDFGIPEPVLLAKMAANVD